MVLTCMNADYVIRGAMPSMMAALASAGVLQSKDISKANDKYELDVLAQRLIGDILLRDIRSIRPDIDVCLGFDVRLDSYIRTLELDDCLVRVRVLLNGCAAYPMLRDIVCSMCVEYGASIVAPKLSAGMLTVHVYRDETGGTND